MSAADVIRDRAEQLVAQAARLGFVLTVEQRPLQPLAAGHHETVVSVRPARVRAQPRRFDLDDLCRAAMERLTAGIDEAVDEARHDQSIEGILARLEMEDRHHGPRGASGFGLGVKLHRPKPDERIFITVGGGGGGGSGCGGNAMGGRL